MCLHVCVFSANSHVQNNVQNKNFLWQLSMLFGAQLSERMIYYSTLFHLLFPPQSLAIWFPPYYLNVLLRSLTSVSFPSNTVPALLTIPLNVSPLVGYWDADFSHLFLLTFEHLTGLSSSSVKGGCSQGACPGPVPLAWVLLGYLTCAQVFSMYLVNNSQGRRGWGTLGLDLLI